MRLKESLKIVKTCKGRSLSTVLPGNPKKGTKDIPIRVISVDLGNGTTEYLATNIPEEEIPLDCYKELYFKRWPIELKYNEIKNQHLLEEFTGKTSISVLQERLSLYQDKLEKFIDLSKGTFSYLNIAMRF